MNRLFSLMRAGHRALIATALTIAGTVLASAAHAQMFLTDIGRITARDINNRGEVVGDSGRVFLYSSGSIRDLGLPASYRSEAWSINDSGQVTGSFYPLGNPSATRAFIYSSGTTQLLGTLDNGFYSDGASINASGQVTGRSNVSSNGGIDYRAFLYSNGVMQDLGTLGGRFSYGNSINDAGQVVGMSALAAGGRHAFLYDDGVMNDLGTFGGNESTAYSINNNGMVVGGATTVRGAERAFLYTDGSMQDLGALMSSPFATSRALDINSLGQVVGSAAVSETGATGLTHGFLYTDGAMVDLNSLIDPSSPLAMYVTLTEGVAINDQGWIAANGVDSRNGFWRAYLLSPVAPVPLPAAAWLLLSGLGGIAAFRPRRATPPLAVLP